MVFGCETVLDRGDFVNIDSFVADLSTLDCTAERMTRQKHSWCKDIEYYLVFYLF